MILTIDRASSKKDFYRFSFGVDHDIAIFQDSLYMPWIGKEVMSEIDKIITNSPNLIFCVTHIKHPLLLENYKAIDTPFSESSSTNVLRDYFAIRLIHRRFPVELIELGKRLFKG